MRSALSFESSVILEGSKTRMRGGRKKEGFESSVILEGSKTVHGALTLT